jgi:hypothetical protein
MNKRRGRLSMHDLLKKVAQFESNEKYLISAK